MILNQQSCCNSNKTRHSLLTETSGTQRTRSQRGRKYKRRSRGAETSLADGPRGWGSESGVKPKPQESNQPGPGPGGGLRASRPPEAGRESSEHAPPWDATSHHHILCPPWTQCQGRQRRDQVPKGTASPHTLYPPSISKMALHRMFIKINAVQFL